MQASESRSARKDLARCLEKTGSRDVLIRKLLILGLEKIFKAISSTVICDSSRNFHETSANDSIAKWMVSYHVREKNKDVNKIANRTDLRSR